MLKPRLLQFSLLCFFLLASNVAQEEVSESSQEAQQDIFYEENLEKQLESFKNSQTEAAQAMDLLSPEQKKKLMEAVASGDQAKVEALMKDITLSASKNPEGMQRLIKYSLQQFRQKSFDQVKGELQSKIGGTLFDPIVKAAPKFLDFVVNLLRDPIALPEFFKIAANRTRLLIFLGINILLFIIKWVIRRNEKNKKAPFSERMSRFVFFLGLRFVLVGVFFHEELWPIVIVAKRTFS